MTTDTKSIPRKPASLWARIAAKDLRTPGTVSEELKRRMGEAMADLFDAYGVEAYASIVSGMKQTLLDTFSATFNTLDASVREELGRRGLQESKKYIGQWADEIVEDVIRHGIEQGIDALQSLADDLAAEYIIDDSVEPEQEDLYGVDTGDGAEIVEEVEEEEVAPPAAEQTELPLEEPAGPIGGEENMTEVTTPEQLNLFAP